MRSMRVLLGALGTLATVVSGQDTFKDNPPPDTFIRRSYTSVTIIGDYVYIDGGEMSQMRGDEMPPPDEAHTLVNSTLSFNISTSWATSKVNIHAIDKPAPKLSRQVLWKGEDPNVFWIWGGKTLRAINKDDISKDTIWRFTADGKGGGDWSSEIPGSSADFKNMHLPSRSGYTTYKNTGFAFGGEILPDTDPQISVELLPAQGMTTFDLKSQTFHNESMPDVSPHGTLAGSTAEYIPIFGPNGVIMILGGYGYTLDTDARPPEHTRRFDNLTFFDPESRKWGWQMATGDIPPPRLDHCSVGVSSGRDTYEIFIFGGNDPTNTKTYEDLHVLTLPGFKWTRIEATSGGTRSGQACVSTGNRQMLSIGGINTHIDTPWEDKDPFPQGLGVFDMTDLKWKDNYDHNAAAYDSPQSVQAFYNSGGLDSVKWSSPDTEDLFTSVNPDSGGKTTSKGAIAGGVVGGVAGLALIGVIVWWLLRRRRKTAGSGGKHLAHAEMDASPKPTELPHHGASPLSYQAASPSLQPVATASTYQGFSPQPPPSELQSKDTPQPAPVELDASAVELDGTNEIGHRGR